MTATSSLTMAATFIESSFPSTNSELNILVPPPNSYDTSVQHMPNVLIIPPEEEHEKNPPWTYFDAETDAQAGLSTSPDIDTLDVALGIFQQTDNRSPAFHRSLSNESSDTVIMPKKISSGVLDASSDLEPDARQGRGMGEDIIEVVKVRRNEGMSDVTESTLTGLKKSKSFRARASQALKTIKGVASKGSRKSSFSSTNSAEPWPSHGDTEHPDETLEAGILPRSSTPSMSRRKSMQLSQLFSSTRKRTSSTVTTTTTTTTSPDVPESPMSSDFSIISTPTEESFPTLSDRTNQDVGMQSGSLTKGKSFRNRISVLDLQRLFAPSPLRPIPAPESAPTLRTPRRDSLPVPQSLPQLSHISADEDVFAANSPLQRPHSFHAPAVRYSMSLPQSSADSAGASPHPGQENIPEETCFEAEMRLDSLQFDSLHFDPDEFTL